MLLENLYHSVLDGILLVEMDEIKIGIKIILLKGSYSP